MAYNVYVVGNGFDLCHGLKTGYKDFVKCVEDAFAKSKEQRSPFEVRLTELCNVNGFFRHFHFSLSEDPSWSYFEEEMDNILRTMTHFQSVILENQKDPEYDLSIYNIIGSVFTYNDMLIFKHFARIFEQVYDDPSGGLFKLRQAFITPQKRLDKQAMIAQVRRELDGFTQALDLYLSHVCAAQEQVLLPNLRPDYVINFNYTDTPLRYSISEEQLFYAKGKLGSEPSRIVLGSPTWAEDLDWSYVNNTFQGLMKFVGFTQKECLAPTDAEGNTREMEVHVYGYSFPQGDGDLLQMLFAAAARIRVFYRDREEYARLMLRLMKLFGKNKIVEMLYKEQLLFCELSL